MLFILILPFAANYGSQNVTRYQPIEFNRVQLSLATPNPSVPWKIAWYIQRFGIESTDSVTSMNTVTR